MPWRAHRAERGADCHATDPGPQAQWRSGRNAGGDARIRRRCELPARCRNTLEAENRKNHTSRTGCLRRICQRGIQLAARTGERGHDRTNGDRRDRGDLLVGTALELSKYKYFAESWRQCLKGQREALVIVRDNSESFRGGARLLVQLFVEFHV